MCDCEVPPNRHPLLAKGALHHRYPEQEYPLSQKLGVFFICVHRR